MNRWSLRWVAGIALGVMSSNAQAQKESFPILVNQSAGDFGFGYSALEGRVHKKCVSDREQTPTTPLTFNEFKLTRVKSRSEYRSTMQFDAAASFGFGMYSGHASVSAYSEDRQSLFSHMVWLRSDVQTHQKIFIRPVFESDALEALKESAQAFYDRCGTGFIEGYIYGGNFVGIYQLTTKEMYRERDVAASIDVTIGSYGSGSASLKTTTTDLSRTENLSYQTVQYAGKEIPPNSDPDAIEKYAREFRTQAAKDPFPLTALIQDYQGLNLNGCGKLISRCKRNLHSFASQMRMLHALVEMRENGLDLRDSLREAHDLPSNFWGTNALEISDALDKTESLLSEVTDAAKKCRDNPFAECTMPNLKYPRVQLRRALWKDIEIKKDDGGKIGEVQPGEIKVVAVRGSGWKGNANLTVCNHSDTLRFTVTNTLKGKVGEYSLPVPLLVGPPPGQGILEVSARAAGEVPGQYFDNVPCNPDEPLQAALVDASSQERATLRTAQETNMRIEEKKRLR